MNHELKTWPEYFQAVKSGEKTFELRKDDRDFRVGDILCLEEYDPNFNCYTGDEINVSIEYMLHGPFMGLANGYCIMSIKPIS